jgi:hypothetical protein
MAPPTLEELVYSAAQRALDQQSTALSDLRTRTSTLVAAATLSASFLGAARGLREAYRENQEVIERRELVFRLALLSLGVETLLWALALALT